ncbi:MAG TPA: hypothetical protein DCS43_07560 [Verrucomicrobia bacterium]|nr:hypothetical protein [Verrucomicrobiota bacterium]
MPDDYTTRNQSPAMSIAHPDSPPPNDPSESVHLPDPADYQGQLHLEKVDLPLFFTGRIVALPVTLHNESRVVWPAAGDHPVRVAYHWLRPDGTLWVRDGRRTNLSGDLGPGESIALEAVIESPDEPGAAILQLTAVQERRSWFEPHGFSKVDLNVEILDFTEYARGGIEPVHDLPEPRAGETVSLAVRLRNEGAQIWPAQGFYAVRISYHWYSMDDHLVERDGLRTNLPADLKGGESRIMAAQVKMPPNPGTYILEWTVVQDRVAWLEKSATFQSTRTTVEVGEPLPETEREAITSAGDSHAARLARQDDYFTVTLAGRRFGRGIRPVIRWIKGDGLDDDVTRTAIAEATRRFGQRVDYCLCTNGINADRVRDILAWAVEPVEWQPVTPADNLTLATRLEAAGCPPEHYGYWWKWFPERVRGQGPEWILDGDMVITGAPTWFDQWRTGQDECRVTQDDRWPKDGLYGHYAAYVDNSSRLYSGLIALPPGLYYMPAVEAILGRQPLNFGHDGRRDMCEQGVIAAAFQTIGATPIPLYEFPFARAFEEQVDYGVLGDQGTAWGYHFGNAFRRRNLHFERLTAQGVLFSRTSPLSLLERFAWMKNAGQWGIPGWGMPDDAAVLILEYAQAFIGQTVLELGTSRGRMSAMLASLGCRVTTVDRHDRGARQNLEGLKVTVIVDDAVHYLATTTQTFPLIVIDFHGNAPTQWQTYAPLLQRCLAQPGLLLIDNAVLWKIPEWKEETGVRWFLERLPEGWTVHLHEEPLPGVAVVRTL